MTLGKTGVGGDLLERYYSFDVQTESWYVVNKRQKSVLALGPEKGFWSWFPSQFPMRFSRVSQNISNKGPLGPQTLLNHLTPPQHTLSLCLRKLSPKEVKGLDQVHTARQSFLEHLSLCWLTPEWTKTPEMPGVCGSLKNFHNAWLDGLLLKYPPNCTTQ